MPYKGQINETRVAKIKQDDAQFKDFVLEKSIFSNIFEKDIRRVFIYKKTERLAKAIHLITPAFSSSPSLRNRLDTIAVGLVDAAISPTGSAKEAFSRELLALSSVLAIARSSAMLSSMNANLITNEAHTLLAEIAAYEEPQLFLDDSPTLADIAKGAHRQARVARGARETREEEASHAPKLSAPNKGHISDIKVINPRRDSILTVIRDKGTVYIKDISTVIREVSEKTIQRELQKLVEEGAVLKRGERRWSTYSLP